MAPYLIVGLGNPGKEYARTFHNAGFLALLALRQKLEEEAPAALRHHGHFWYRKYGKIILAGYVPEDHEAGERALFMNESGRAVREALDFFKVRPEKLVVLHDDSDLALGDCRLEFGRGPAGHHGVESVIEHLGTNQFWRGRIGIRPESAEGRRPKAGEFVLKNAGAAEEELLRGSFGKLCAEIITLAAPGSP